MRVLHTSDWHIGKSLFGRKRYQEFEAFLDWLVKFIEEEQVDALLVAGDVFDTSLPSNKAQELYYQFLFRVAHSCCRHVVVIGGNHDSPTFLNAPKELLRALNVFVVGAKTENIEDEVLLLKNKDQKLEAVICAVPYLRDKDIRTVEVGETVEDKSRKLIEGIAEHYREVCAIAEKKTISEKGVPIIAMGHLFTAGAKTLDGDGVRELYVGSLAHIGKNVFPTRFDYLALGHLHVPQRVGGIDHMRYSGSPIPMGFGESNQEKKIVLAEFEGGKRTIQEYKVPCFQRLEKISGTMEDIQRRIEELIKQDSSAWLEIEYTGSSVVSNLKNLIEENLHGSRMEIRRIINRKMLDQFIEQSDKNETLDDLNVFDVFQRRLENARISEEDRDEMNQLYKEIVNSYYEEDSNA